MKMEVLNNPRTAWYATARDATHIFLTVSLMTGHGQNKQMLDYSTTLEKRNGRWYVYAFYVDGIFRLGKGHSGSCASSSCKVTGINDYKAGGPSGRSLTESTGRIETMLLREERDHIKRDTGCRRGNPWPPCQLTIARPCR